MPRQRPRPPPPCPNCSSDLRKHDKLDGGQRYRCPDCRTLIRPGKTADWVALSGEVLRGSTFKAIAENLGTDEDTARRMLAAWGQRACDSRQAALPIGTGQGWWKIGSGGRTIAVGVQRGKALRVVGWDGGSGPGLPTTAPASKEIQTGAKAWVSAILKAAGADLDEQERRLWVALARTNAWPMA